MRDTYACRLPVLGDGRRTFDALAATVKAAVSPGGGPEALERMDGTLTLDSDQSLRWHLIASPDGAERCAYLVVLEEAVESAAKAPYRQPGRVWHALQVMDEIAGAWRGDELGMSFFEAFTARGFAFRSHVSATALGKYRHEYERSYGARVVALGPHLALGRGSPDACCRIY